jgi:hypothetical protein
MVSNTLERRSDQSEILPTIKKITIEIADARPKFCSCEPNAVL